MCTVEWNTATRRRAELLPNIPSVAVINGVVSDIPAFMLMLPAVQSCVLTDGMHCMLHCESVVGYVVMWACGLPCLSS